MECGDGTEPAATDGADGAEVGRPRLDDSYYRELFASLADAVVLLSWDDRVPAVAEGVETKAQLDFLTEEGCGVAQGFYFSRPLPPDEIDRLLREGSERIASQIGPRRLRSVS